MNSYLEFLENQLVIEALEQRSYSIENFDSLEQDRLMLALRNGDDLLFEWYVNKNKKVMSLIKLDHCIKSLW